MTKQLAGLTTIVVLALSIGAFVGSALAGNGHGNGNAPESPGNSANAPGQLKQDESGADANASAAQAGVKPTDSTAHGNHNTSCTTGGGTGSSATCASSGSNAATAQTAAHADASKRYGNGSTAAQIANGNGAPAGTTVYGPGNSQPHKVTDCKHKHAVDVHAVKSYSSAACTQQAASSTGSTSHRRTRSIRPTRRSWPRPGPRRSPARPAPPHRWAAFSAQPLRPGRARPRAARRAVSSAPSRRSDRGAFPSPASRSGSL
jgi:hypothetical protein